MSESDAPARVAAVLVEVVRSRPELVDRADRCRAVLNDVLAESAASARREVGLVCAAVEDGVPSALRVATTVPEVDAIIARFGADRALTPDAARWAVVTWTDTLRSMGWSSAPTTPREMTEGDSSGAPTSPVATVPGDLTPAPPGDAITPQAQPRRRLGRMVGIAVLVLALLVGAGVIVATSGGDGGSAGSEAGPNRGSGGADPRGNGTPEAATASFEGPSTCTANVVCIQTPRYENAVDGSMSIPCPETGGGFYSWPLPATARLLMGKGTCEIYLTVIDAQGEEASVTKTITFV